ncbi:glycosyl transferase group 1 [gut metagenome]|uniref:Glycosyl transferase group 1 n=1 Tax=gut metagenome TaxID=749906 RepID=J9GF19_9ZZZZ
MKNRIMTIWNSYRAICHWHKEHPDGILICDIILGECSLGVCLASILHHDLKTTAIVTDVPSIRAGDTRKGLKAIPVKIKNAAIQAYSSYIFLTEKMNERLNPKHKPYVVVEGVADENVKKEPNTLDNKYAEKVVMMAGLLEDVFGVDSLLEAFKQVECPEARLRFYGRGASVEKIRAASKQDSRISFCGELTNQQIVKEEKKATLLINPRPPLGEWTAYSFPSKNMEYMASGTPLVAYDLPCIPNEYKNYFYQIKECSVEGLRSALQELLNKDAESLHKFGIEAQNWITTAKVPKAQMKKFIQIIQ